MLFELRNNCEIELELLVVKYNSFVAITSKLCQSVGNEKRWLRK